MRPTPPAVWRKLAAELRNLGRPGVGFMALSAVDVALWDLKARLLDLPLVDVLPAARDRVPVYGSGGFCNYPVDRLRAQLGGWVADGISRVKLKISRHPDEDPARLDAARAEIGDHVELFADANGALTRKQALGWAERLAGEWGVSWFEEPVSSADFEGLRLLRDRGPGGLDIAAGEYAFVAADFRNLLEAGAVDCLQADVTRCGGITGLLGAAALAEAHGIDVSAHCAPQLSAHAFCAVQRLRHLEYFHDHVRIEGMLFDGVLAPEGGALRPDRCTRRARPGAPSGRRGGVPAVSSVKIPARIDRRFRGGMAATAEVDRRGLARSAARLGRGRGPLRRRRPGAVRDRRLQLPPAADRRRRPEDARRRRRHAGRVRAVRRADRLARRRNEPLGRDRQLRGRDRPLQVPARDRRPRPRAGHGPGRERRGQRAGERALREVERAVRPGSVHAQVLHDRREHRQQLVRDPLRAGAVLRARAPHLGQRPLARGRHLRGRSLLGRRDGRRGARAHRRRRRPPRRDLRRVARPARPPRRRDPRALPERRSPAAARLRLQPRRAAAREGLQRRPGARRHRVDLRDRAPGGAVPDAGDAPARAGRGRIPGHLRRGRRRPVGDGAPADRVRGDRPHPVRRRAAQEHAPVRAEAAPCPRRGRRVAARRVRRRHDGGGGRACASVHARRAEARRRRGGDQPVRGRRGGAAPLGGARGRTGRDRVPAGRQGPLARLGGLGGAAGAGRRLPARPQAPLRRVRLPRRDVRPRRSGLRPLAHRLRPAHRPGARRPTAASWRRPPTSSSPTAARFRASTATDSSGRSCFPRCSARAWSTRSASSRRSGIRSGR